MGLLNKLMIAKQRGGSKFHKFRMHVDMRAEIRGRRLANIKPSERRIAWRKGVQNPKN